MIGLSALSRRKYFVRTLFIRATIVLFCEKSFEMCIAYGSLVVLIEFNPVRLKGVTIQLLTMSKESTDLLVSYQWYVVCSFHGQNSDFVVVPNLLLQRMQDVQYLCRIFRPHVLSVYKIVH